MGAIMTSDNEVVTFDFYSSIQSSLYHVEFDARFDLDPDGKFGNLLDDFFSLTITKSKEIKYHSYISMHADISECDPVGDEIADIVDRFLSEKPMAPIYFTIDKEDNKDGGRTRLFERWYQQNGNRDKYFFEVYPLENAKDGNCDSIGVIIPIDEKTDLTMDSFLLSFTY